MARHKKHHQQSKKQQSLEPSKLEGVSKRGWKVIGIGASVVAFGFYILSLTDPSGQNWASNLSPFLLLGGYATIAIGIILPESSNSTSQTETNHKI